MAFTVIFASLLYYRRKLKKTERELATEESAEEEIDHEKDEIRKSPNKYRTLSESSEDKNIQLTAPVAKPEAEVSPITQEEPQKESEISNEDPHIAEKWENVQESNISQILQKAEEAQQELRKDEKKDSAFETSESEAEILERTRLQPHGIPQTEIIPDENENTTTPALRLKPLENTVVKVFGYTVKHEKTLFNMNLRNLYTCI